MFEPHPRPTHPSPYFSSPNYSSVDSIRVTKDVLLSLYLIVDDTINSHDLPLKPVEKEEVPEINHDISEKAHDLFVETLKSEQSSRENSPKFPQAEESSLPTFPTSFSDSSDSLVLSTPPSPNFSIGSNGIEAPDTPPSPVSSFGSQNNAYFEEDEVLNEEQFLVAKLEAKTHIAIIEYRKGDPSQQRSKDTKRGANDGDDDDSQPGPSGMKVNEEKVRKISLNPKNKVGVKNKTPSTWVSKWECCYESNFSRDYSEGKKNRKKKKQRKENKKPGPCHSFNWTSSKKCEIKQCPHNQCPGCEPVSVEQHLQLPPPPQPQ
ncbi:hypothetical protein G7Y89_g7977 [Cudoniella acicularis]|uniref:Uncharacterized protein n=1 Tax=Cudoniella acicularis TaxID=354080 RepID=A0A8H4W1I8_9HELO|nr:hypothetical protein G7Y89_g7977 [Cudoniella acicularis]